MLKQKLVWIFPPDIDILEPLSLSHCIWAHNENRTKPVTRALDNFQADVKRSVLIVALWNECAENGTKHRDELMGCFFFKNITTIVLPTDDNKLKN